MAKGFSNYEPRIFIIIFIIMHNLNVSYNVANNILICLCYFNLSGNRRSIKIVSQNRTTEKKEFKTTDKHLIIRKNIKKKYLQLC